ncbi:MAG TPA: DegT/DnrJ/EryC1/StrS aminotransferase family protein [Thermoanaerobaculia bacterium]|nr:DegT/DnrJ/EryC1/StrS aminotransferase family protein [Thermoanaerobaculia bacterium]
MKNAFLEEQTTKRELSEFIMNARRLSMDMKCLEFERAFADYQGSQEAVLFNSGGSANLAMLQALRNLGRLGPGAKVGFSSLTWSTNTMPIIQLGMTPVALDVDPNTLNVMSQNVLERLEDVELDALFLTNVLGFAGDLDVIRDLCNERGIILIEDNCESLGTELPSGRTGNFGVAGSFSFFVAHHMSTIEGGMACTNDAELAEMLRIVRANGWDRNLTSAQQFKWRKRFDVKNEFEAKYTFYDLGYNLRPTEITGFLGLVQMRYLTDNIRQRQDNYLRLEGVISANPDLLTLRRDHLTVLSSFALPIITRTTELRDHYAAQFSGAGVEIRPLIAGNMQRQPFYAKYVEQHYDVPGADQLHDCGFYCGNYPELTEVDLETLTSCLRQF